MRSNQLITTFDCLIESIWCLGWKIKKFQLRNPEAHRCKLLMRFDELPRSDIAARAHSTFSALFESHELWWNFLFHFRALGILNSRSLELQKLENAERAKVFFPTRTQPKDEAANGNWKNVWNGRKVNWSRDSEAQTFLNDFLRRGEENSLQLPPRLEMTEQRLEL